ncbi:MAG: hypothetical protein PHH59_00800 [Methylovulum sp.]|uniref:hypothetical protein n=1 Tax=Methylovulum sp. TaxID=1916980 RepID=UPI00262046D1|nr:hypothetical protein [Methylovulum sp.]MDD2722545.1 hypothetical protein [Methylovulum sp.]MDD5123073.1 hypothetical protein [Methylovulum sp.]
MTMTASELDILHSHIDTSTKFLEFGAGASTLYAASVPSIKQIDSVESSVEFVNENLKPNPVISEAVSAGRLLFHIIDIGKTFYWGYPASFCKKHLWPDYSFRIFRQKSEHDLVLIDGRFRVACTLNTILNTPENCKILIHDFWNRPHYHIVLSFLETQVEVDTLGVFTKKPSIDRRQVKSLIEKYKYLPR